jgi:ABC-type nickel/cobalt efflux system permease component RcnA
MSMPGPAAARTLALLIGLSATLALPALAQQHAHTHGRMALDVAVDAQTITLAIESPLDGFLGFERAPRTEAERQRVSAMVAQLNAADRLFQPDPAAGCKLSRVELQSAALGLGTAKAQPAQGHDHDHAHGKGHDHAHDHGDGGHADIAATIVFACDKAAQARFIDVKLFDASKRIQTIDAQVASPQGQSKQTLRPAAARLKLAR